MTDKGNDQISPRDLPKVDDFLSWVLEIPAPPTLKKKVVRGIIAALRDAVLSGAGVTRGDLSRETLALRFSRDIVLALRPNFRKVINATGVVVHTNLGRSVLPAEALRMLTIVGGGYSNLEFDLNTGRRGSRYSLVADLLCEITGAEAALVVNNNAAAVMLCLDTLARGREVVVSRGQLVEIGGSFRIPDVMSRTGAILKEVGATNRTHPEDYEKAINENTAMLLKVHTSNYRIIGFTEEVSGIDLAGIGRRHALPVMEDLGSGCLVDLAAFGISREPTVGEVVKSGIDIVTFSGDKLLGGPQAGIIVGKKALLEEIRANPMNRALRIDKFTLAGLEAVLRLYLDNNEAVQGIPTLTMLAAGPAEIKKKARRLARLLKGATGQCGIDLVPVSSRVGGGALPDQALPSFAVSLAPRDMSTARLEARLRGLELPVIGRIDNDRLILDLRTVAVDEIRPVAAAVNEALGRSDEPVVF